MVMFGSERKTAVVLLMLTAVGLGHCQTQSPTLTASDAEVMQRCAELVNATNQDGYTPPGDNPCDWLGDFPIEVTCSNTSAPNAARVTSIYWGSATGDFSNLGLEKLDALQTLTISSLSVGLGDPTNIGDPTLLFINASSALATGMRSLEYLALSSMTVNDFRAWFVLGAFPALSTLYLWGVALPGGLPSAVDGAFPNLTTLTIGVNNISGTFPTTWGRSDGMFGGLQTLIMNWNKLTGPLPEYTSPLSPHWVNLTSLDFSNNNFTGSLPNSWATQGSFGSLLTVMLDNNVNLTGTLPSNWSSGLFRLTPSNQEIFRQAVQSFRDNLGSDVSNANMSNPLAYYSFANLGLTGSIPASWASQSPAAAAFALGLGLNATEQQEQPTYPHLSVNPEGTKLCGSLPANVTLLPSILNRFELGDSGPVATAPLTLPACTAGTQL